MSIFWGFVFLLSASASAFEGSVTFSDQEIQRHQSGVQSIIKVASECLRADLAYHHNFYKKHGIAGFYGDRSSFAKLPHSQKQQQLSRLGKNPALLSQMYPTSCVGLTRKCLGRGFEIAGQKDIWVKIDKFVMSNAVDGTAMQLGLQKLGWKVLYWNPDLSQNKSWDEIEKRNDPTNKQRFWGYHEYRWVTVRNKGTYYFNPVDDFKSLVNFRANVPASFAKVPFFVGTAHTGYHVFPGAFGQVIEAHSTRAITDYYTLESAPFNPLANGGAPRGQYFSGLLAIPPGFEI